MESKKQEIKHKEKDLTKNNELLTTLFSKLHSGIIAEDENRKVVFTNQMYCDIFSLDVTPDQMVGVDHSDSAEETKHLFKRPVSYVAEINKLLHFKQPVIEQVIEMNNGRFFERNYMPIYIDDIYKGTLWKFTDVTEKIRTEKELKRSEENYRNIIEHATDIIYKSNNKGLFCFVNPKAERITGYSKDELLKMHFSSLIRSDYRLKAVKFYINQVKNKIPSTYLEFPIITKKGQEVWMGQSVQFSLTNLDPEDFELTSLAIDITKQKKAEQELRESNQKLMLLQSLIDNSSDSMQVTTEDGQLFYINKEASQNLGIPLKKSRDYNIKDLEENTRGWSSWEEYIDTVKQNNILTMEGTNTSKTTGKQFPVEDTLRYITIEDKGYIITNSRDITARKRIENLLKKQEEKYRNIIANMHLGLIEVSPTEEILYANHGFCKMSGFSLEELLGKKATDVFVTEQNLELIQNKSKLRSDGISDMYQMPVKTKNGQVAWWVVSGAPNFNDSGEFMGSIGIHLDITEQKKLESELETAKIKAEEASKAKEAFLANMSHEIRTPLNAIIGMIRELGKEDLNAAQKSYVENSSVASKHLLSIINNVLDISKIEANELTLDSEHFIMAQSINNILSMMSSRAEEKGIYIKSEVSDKIHEALIGDPLRIEQILLNLVGNAVKFTNRGGITIKCDVLRNDDHEQELQLAVIDTGVGMDEHYLKNVFKKFSQEDKSVSRKYGGTGLGLAISFELVQLMEGVIEVTSEKKAGTIFYVKVTLKKGSAANVKSIFRSNEAVSIDGIKILLVEDNEINRLVAQNTFKYHKCEVDEAVNGLDALEKLKLKTYDVILMDIQMPEMDGLEATEKIRNELKISTPVIALTANAFKSEIEKCKVAGMNDYITKPFEESALLKLISKYTKNELSQKSKTEPGKQQIVTGKLYDLTLLNGMSRGDKEFINKMITLFIEQAKVSLTEINAAHLVQNNEIICKAAHKIKPSIDNMGIISLKKEIRELESLAKENNSPDKITSLIQYLNSTLALVIEQLSSEII